MADADEIIAALAMQPHPEGGWYSETFRDGKGGARGHSTAIYYLLKAGQRSHWHRVKDAAEIWHYYAGAPLALYRCDDGMTVETLVLGTDLVRGERPQAVIPALSWQAAESLGDYTLVGCTVAPGFTFDTFEMAPPGWKPGQPLR
ncbi:cupin domain-containing protein [Agrobacterium vitis]|uniref:Cupin n=1 Tax=Agrobacterium vitis TaxID=373 RepID=A0AAE4WC46_AGRVI|nr:cupin domain-containing protein [Agrobacterium vitis]MCF1498042.1 cupin domain-containing protein [Allorhizobium sp. Av2]MCM2440165.1 cupin domain-containing protein [Agrobacterium vitis]MUZ57961.1 cupin [Agrobacterium vitis]MVA67507.1 cupin [Agrobacterium vitis]MVA86841.1 cupin [Agrobacterium vitis]